MFVEPCLDEEQYGQRIAVKTQINYCPCLVFLKDSHCFNQKSEISIIDQKTDFLNKKEQQIID